MFTGLIETIGVVRRLDRRSGGLRLVLESHWPDTDSPKAGDSIAVDGCCLTALESCASTVTAELSPETIARTRFATLRVGSKVNLERSLKLGDRLGGHFVQGHVDGLARLQSSRAEGAFRRLRFAFDRKFEAEIVEKGSLAIDGVSLTVACCGPGWAEVALIPLTLEKTTLGSRRVSDQLHLETDIIGKYAGKRLSLGSGIEG